MAVCCWHCNQQIACMAFDEQQPKGCPLDQMPWPACQVKWAREKLLKAGPDAYYNSEVENPKEKV